MFSFDESAEPYPVPATATPLGAVHNADENCTMFSLWAPGADNVEVLLYERGGKQPVHRAGLAYNEGSGVWQSPAPISGYGGYSYTFSVLRDNHRRECLDPYARAMEPVRVAADRTIPDSGRGIVVDVTAVLADLRRNSPDRPKALASTESIIYEVHVRDFTIFADTTSKPGTLAAFRERVSYLSELGVTHVQLLPVLKSCFIDELQQNVEHSGRTHSNNYNWGYDPQNFFSLNGWLTENPADPARGIRELRSLVDTLHAAGIKVILDVVYNHMGDARFLEDIVPHYYFRRHIDGSFTSNSGCGNDLATCHVMTRRLIIDSLCYLAETFAVDGFRFDLMGLIDSDTLLQAKSRVEQLTGCTDILFFGEGWRMYNGPEGTRALDQDFMTETDQVAVFNDELRDLLKAGGLSEEGNGFLTNCPIDTHQLYRNLLGDPQEYFRVMTPQSVVNYMAAHDGLTLHDAIAHNAGLSPQDSSQRRLLQRRIRMANFLLLCSQGIIFLHAGQERGRTKNVPSHQAKCVGNYVRDSYNSDDHVNGIVWECSELCESIHAYTSNMIALRRALPVFHGYCAELLDRRSEFIPMGSGLSLGFALRCKKTVYIVLANSDFRSITVVLPDQLANRRIQGQPRRVLADVERVDPRGIENPSGLALLADTITLDPLAWALIAIDPAGEPD